MGNRIQVTFIIFLILLSAIVLRLFYWQVIVADELTENADRQHFSSLRIQAERGEVFASDGFPLVLNKPLYSVTAYTPNIKDDPKSIVSRILPFLKPEIDDPEIATDPAKLAKFTEEWTKSQEVSILDKLLTKRWSVLARGLESEQKDAISGLNIHGLAFEEELARFYPEASMSAHLLGFVGKTEIDEPVGYFGLEGYYNRELSGRTGIQKLENDASGRPLIVGDFHNLTGRDGRDIKLHLERGVQYIAESELKKGLEKYGASSGEVVIMDPKTGGILGMASFPNYDPGIYTKFPTAVYKNPVVGSTYEPGSTFKVLVMAAALNEKVLTPDTVCDICTGPLEIGKYTIKTWDNKYRTGSNATDVIVHSDNIGMVWTQRKLGGEKMLEYLKNFGIGEKTGIDLQEEITPSLRTKWGDIDFATSSFGQGIAVTSIQMVRAVGALANGGVLVEPHVVKEVLGEKPLPVETKAVRQVVSPEAAAAVTEMMVRAVEDGEAKWTRIKGYRVAGKTGTAQIPVSGHYDDEKTIASFVGFAPVEDPRFVMLVKLREPTTSPWGSETAAPLWFSIAKKLLIHLNIPPTVPE